MDETKLRTIGQLEEFLAATPGWRFPQRALLVEMDRAHEDVCGAAIAHRLQRAHRVYGDTRYERLAELLVSHL